jgi:hypothetical protein
VEGPENRPQKKEKVIAKFAKFVFGLLDGTFQGHPNADIRVGTRKGVFNGVLG